MSVYPFHFTIFLFLFLPISLFLVIFAKLQLPIQEKKQSKPNNMKSKISLLLSGILLLNAISANVTAQEIKTDDYLRFNASFVTGQMNLNTSVSGTGSVSTDLKSNGFNISLIRGRNLTNGNSPFFLEVGGELTYQHIDDDYFTYKFDLNQFSIAVPFNFTYIITVPNTSIDIAPLVGLNAKLNLMGKGKVDGDDINFFTSGEADSFGDKEKANRFQIGMNIGANIYINNFLIGYRYQPDFNPYYKETADTYPSATLEIKRNTHYISIGCRF